MSDIKFKLNLSGLRELMKSADMRQVLNSAGVVVTNKAEALSGGEDFSHAVKILDYTAVATVFPNSKEAYRAAYKNNILEKSLSGLPRTKR